MTYPDEETDRARAVMVKEARTAYHRALDAQAEAANAARRARQALVRAMRERFEARVAALPPGAGMLDEQLTELGLPCDDCAAVYRPGTGHEVVVEGSIGGPARVSARCGQRS